MKSLRIVFFVFLLTVSLLTGASERKVECVAGCGSGPLGSAAREAKLIEPFGVNFDQEGNWYICEYKGQRVTRVDSKGTISLFAGTGEQGHGGDGGPADRAKLNEPHSLYIKSNQMYIADTRNNRVRKVDLKTRIITTIAGTGQAGYSGDGGPATEAQFHATYDLALDEKSDSLYIADLNNRRIRLLDLKTGIVRTVAGTGIQGVPQNGAKAVESPLVDPRAVVLDQQGNLYILSRRGNALRIVSKEGFIRTLVGPGDVTPDLNGPKHMCVGPQGSVIIADTENHLIRKYSPKDGSLVTIAGTGEAGDRIDPVDPLKTQLNRPHGVYIDRSGALYISDSHNHRILRVAGW